VNGPAYGGGTGSGGGTGDGDRRDGREGGAAAPGPTPAAPGPGPAGPRPAAPGSGAAASAPAVPDHHTLRSLLGAWALSACSREEARTVEVHQKECRACAEEGMRLREAVHLLHQEESLDLDPLLRARVLENCLGRRAARIPMPDWAGPYGSEAARLDALLRDLGEGYWSAPVDLRWFDGAPATRRVTVGQVIAHLTAVDGLVARSLGLATAGAVSGGPVPPAGPAEAVELAAPGVFGTPGSAAGPRSSGAGPRPVTGTADEAGADAAAGGDRWAAGEAGSGAGPGGAGPDAGAGTDAGPGAGLPLDPWERTEAHWAANRRLSCAELRTAWREQSLDLVRTVSFAGRAAGGLDVGYGAFSLPLRDAFLDRALECWIHAGDIADAVDYPYAPPAPRALHQMIDLAARMLPSALAERRRAGLAASRPRLVAAGSRGRSLRLEIDGEGGGDWYVSVDSPAATASDQDVVAHVAMDGADFCQLVAGHVRPEDAAVGRSGDYTVIRDVLYAAASMSRI
jgi:hypothetical protein